MATRRPSVTPSPPSPPGVGDPAAVLASLGRILASPHFSHAPRLSRFLRFVVEESLAGRGERIKEFTIAADVFDRGPDYDPSADAVVRVEASRLRQKLQAYYLAEGRDEPIVVDLPKGGYCPMVRLRHAAPSAGDLSGPAVPMGAKTGARHHGPSAWVVLATLAGGILVGAVVTIGLGDRPALVGAAVPGTVPGARANPPATDPFLRGRYLRQQMTPASLGEAVVLFEQAVALDPTSAEGWAALGEARATLLFHGLVPVEAELPRAKDASVRALALSPGLGEARGVLARLRLVYDWDWPAADREFREAIAQAPGNARLHQWLAFALASRGRFDEAIGESRQARQLAPDAYVGTTDLAVLLFFARRYDEAIQEARAVRQVNPTLLLAHAVEGLCLSAQGLQEPAIAQYQRALDLDPKFSGIHGKLGYAYARLGREAEARAQLASLDRLYAPQPAPATERALVLVGLGDHDAALAALEEAFARREGEMTFFDVHPMFDPLRGDPRFAELRRKAGL